LQKVTGADNDESFSELIINDEFFFSLCRECVSLMISQWSQQGLLAHWICHLFVQQTYYNMPCRNSSI